MNPAPHDRPQPPAPGGVTVDEPTRAGTAPSGDAGGGHGRTTGTTDAGTGPPTAPEADPHRQPAATGDAGDTGPGTAHPGPELAGPAARLRTLAELVRLPAALSVLGDTAVGAAAAGRPLTGRRLGLPLSSAALYLAGMALNDWADRDLDAVERPERPIPSGRISPGAALGVATTLTGAGLALAALGGGRDALRIAVPLAASVWTYDTLLKNTPAAPLGMAVCRGLDVLLGAGARSARAAAPGALAMAAHTAGVTTLAQGEVHGTSRVAAGVALTTTTASTALAVLGPARGGWHRAGAVLAAAGYARTVGGAQLTAARDTSAANARAATGVGIRGMIPLQAALVARRGSLAVSAALAGLVPLGRRLARRVSQT